MLGFFDGAPGAIRTPDLLIRSQMLYPAELRVRGGGFLLGDAFGCKLFFSFEQLFY